MSRALKRVLIVEDDSETVRVLRAVFERTDDFTVTAAYPDLARTRSGSFTADLAIVDIRLPDGLGIDLISELRQKNPAIRILMFTAVEDGDILLKAMSFGASGYVLKGISPDALIDHARVVAKGGVTFSTVVAGTLLGLDRKHTESSILTTREVDVLRNLALGFTSGEIAKTLKLSSATVRKHLENIYRKLDVKSRSGAILFGIEAGILRKP